MSLSWPANRSYGYLITTTFKDGFLDHIGDPGETWKSFLDTRYEPELAPMANGTVRMPDYFMVHLVGPQYGRNKTGYIFDGLLRAQEDLPFTQAGTQGSIPPANATGPFDDLVASVSDFNLLKNGHYTNGVERPMIAYVGQINFEPLEPWFTQYTEQEYLDRLDAAWALINQADWDGVCVDVGSAYGGTHNYNEQHPAWNWLRDKARDPSEPIVMLETNPKWAHRFDFAGCPAVAQKGAVEDESSPDHTRKMSPTDRHRLVGFHITEDIDNISQAQINLYESRQADHTIIWNRYKSVVNSLPPSAPAHTPPRWLTPPSGFPLKTPISRPEVSYEQNVTNFATSRFGAIGQSTTDSHGNLTADFETNEGYVAAPSGKTESGFAFDTSNGNALVVNRSGSGPLCVDFWARVDVAGAGSGAIFRATRASGAGEIYLLQRNNGTHAIGSRRTDGVFKSLTDDLAPFTRGDWHHYSIRFDEHNTRSIEVYIDGLPVGLFDGEQGGAAKTLIHSDVNSAAQPAVPILSELTRFQFGEQGPVADILFRDFAPHTGYLEGLIEGPEEEESPGE